jgi:hypothetical protein
MSQTVACPAFFHVMRKTRYTPRNRVLGIIGLNDWWINALVDRQ